MCGMGKDGAPLVREPYRPRPLLGPYHPWASVQSFAAACSPCPGPARSLAACSLVS